MGFYTDAGWTWDTGPGRAPPGWDFATVPEGKAIGSDSYILALQCERVSWGRFERPMHLLFDYHSRFYPPEKCESPTAYRLRVLNGIWTDDAEFGAFLASAYSLPVHVAAFQISDGNGTPASPTWTWAEAGSQPSFLIVHSTDVGKFPVGFDERLAWDRDGHGVSMLDMDGSADIAGDQPTVSGPLQLVNGTLRPPMLYAEKLEDYAAGGERIIDSNWTGSVLDFEDYGCERPSPSS